MRCRSKSGNGPKCFSNCERRSGICGNRFKQALLTSAWGRSRCLKRNPKRADGPLRAASAERARNCTAVPGRLRVWATNACCTGVSRCHLSASNARSASTAAATASRKAKNGDSGGIASSCSAAIWMGKRDNQDGNPGSRHWHDCRGVTVAQGGLRICIVAARRSGIGRGCRVDGRAAATSLSFERGTAAVAFDVHLEDGGVMNEAVDNSDSHCLVWEDFAPFAERLVGSDEDGSPLITGADEFEKHAGFGLVFGDVGDVIEDQQMEFVELGNSGFESELATGNLQPLDKIGVWGKQHAPAVFDESQAESCRKVALAAARWPKQQ